MELHVLLRGKLPSKAALARVMKQLGFPLTLTPAAGSLEGVSGFMPMRLGREETGVEFDVFEGRDAVEDVAGPDIDPGFERCANFRWGGDENEMLAALCGAAALAKLTNGVVLDDEEDRLMGAAEAVAFARRHLKPIAVPQAKQPGTRPADIKRYLKPLLEQRSDLVLIGRMLVVRPVRHVLRGAFLDRTSDKYSFHLWQYIKPLYNAPEGLGYGDRIRDSLWHVWQPHFEPLLMDVLAEDIFARVGPITTLQDLAATLSGTDQFFTGRVRALVLSGDRDGAAAYIREVEHHDPSNPYWKSWATQQWEFLATDIDVICAELHAREAETVKALKLEHIWEPSPFPVEVPVAEAASRTAEPIFAAKPWISTPPWLLHEPPGRPGDICFAKDDLHRNGRIVLLVPLTRDEAESRHRNGEGYVLASRLEERVLLLLQYYGRDRHDPRCAYVPLGPVSPSSLTLCSSDRFVYVSFSETGDYGFRLFSLSIDEWPTRRSIWLCYANVTEGKVSIYDDEKPRTSRPLTDADREVITCPLPAFGEYEELLTRARSWSRKAGFGEIG
jgi:hypothetical protein